MIKKLSIFLLIVTCFAFHGARSDIYLPVSQPEYQFLYDAARRDEIKTGFYYDNHMTGPYNFSRRTSRYPLSDFLGNPENGQLKLFGLIGEDFESRRYRRGDGYESIRAGVSTSFLKNISVYVNFILNEEWADDPGYTGKKWRGLAGEMENGFIAWRSKQLEIIFGRFGSFWGPVKNSLILSDQARPMDALLLRYHHGRLYYSYQLAKLNSTVSTATPTPEVYNRYFAGHRIDFRPVENINIGLFETIIFGGENRTLEFSYFNPFNFFHGEQLNENIDDNTFLGIDLTWYLNNRYKLYGQFMADDIQIENDAPGDREPDEYGYIIGFEFLDFFNLLDFEVEYTKITNRTYNQKYDYNRYENRGELIGNSLGPDGDIISAHLSRWFDDRYRAKLNLSYRRKGEGRYDSPWTEPWLKIEDYSESFPSGQRRDETIRASLGFTGYWRDLIFIDIEGGVEWLEKSDSSPTASQPLTKRTVPFVKIYLSAFLSTPINID